MTSVCGERKRISMEAAIWMLLLTESDSEEHRSALVAWLTKSRVHVELFLRTAVAMGPADAQREAMLIYDVVGSRPDADERNTANDSAQPRSRSVFPVRNAAVCIIVAAAAICAVWVGSRLLSPADDDQEIQYATAGLFKLGNASVMTLDMKSRASVRSFMSRSGRIVRLHEGHATFEGIHDRKSPLRVVSGSTVIDVIGTDFDVYRDQTETTVKVKDGRVELSSNCEPAPAPYDGKSSENRASASPVATLHRGQMVVAKDGTCTGSFDVKDVIPASVHQETAPPSDWVEFNDTTIREAVDVFNLRGSRRMAVSDPTLGKRRIGGRFRLSDADGFLGFLAMNYGVRIVSGVASDGSPVLYLLSAPRK